MTQEGHTSTRVGHRGTRSRLLLAIRKTTFRRTTGTKQGRTGSNNRQTGSNAQYNLSSAEVNRIIAAASGIRNRAIVRLFAETGIRRFELASLFVTDIKHERRAIVIRNGKGRRPRVVPITRRMQLELADVIGATTDGPVFRSTSGSTLSLRQINRIVATAGRLAGVENPNPRSRNVTCHLFRHTFARLWKERRGSIETLAHILGHARPSTTWSLYGTESQHDVQRNYDETVAKLGFR